MIFTQIAAISAFAAVMASSALAQPHAAAPTPMTSEQRAAAFDLSLIHISEPTRPY